VTRYHVLNRYGNGDVELRPCPNCTTDNCRTEAVNLYTGDELASIKALVALRVRLQQSDWIVCTEALRIINEAMH
jgi:hypothetical protein